MDLKTEIKKYLQRTGMRPYELADKAKVSKTSVYRFLKGERGLLLETADKLKDYIRKAA